jgi:hypothetical protein
MVRHLDDGAVPTEAFTALMQWLTTTWATDPDYPGLSNEDLGLKRNPMREWLEGLKKGAWPRGPKEYRVFVCDAEHGDYYKGLSNQARKCLAIASRALGFLHDAQTMQDDLEFRVAWGKHKDAGVTSADLSDVKNNCVKRVEWLLMAHQSTFSDLVLLGASSMAEALGVGLRVRELKLDGGQFEETRIVVDELERTGNVEDIRESTVFVLELADVTTAVMSRQQHLSQYRVVTTGARGAAVSQDDASIGIQLAEAAIDCQSSSTTCDIAIIASSDTFELGGHQDRVVAFEKRVDAAAKSDRGKTYKVERIGVSCGDYRHPHELCSCLLGKRSADSILSRDVVFAESGDVAEWLLRVFHHLPRRKLPKVFSADLTPSLFNMMWEPDSPLEAVCGVDPYAYGRLIVRAACDTNMPGPIQARPLRVTRTDVRKADIRNYAQWLATNPALQMSDAEFAWQPWMRDLCPFSERHE